MTDRAYEPNEADPFEQIARTGSVAAPADEDQDDPFAKIAKLGGTAPPQQTSATGAFARGVERGVLPAIGSLPAVGAGAELGAGAGALTGPFAPIAVPAGTIIGGAAGGLLGASAISSAQNWLLSKLPDSWREKIGLSDRQEQLDQGEHPVASFLGGIAPYALTMRPGATPKTPLPENATALQRILSHPLTARLFGGAAMGGMELGQEKTEGEPTSWARVAISTGFGMVFNRPTRIGETLTGVGGRFGRAVTGAPEPTIAQAADAKVMGPGVTENVFQGAHEQDQSAAMTAQEGARNEAATIGQPQQAQQLHAVARQMQPEAFALYDDLIERERTLANWIAENPSEELPAAQAHLAATREEIAKIQPEIAAAYRRAAEVTGAETSPATPEGQRYPSMAAMLAAQGQPAEAAPTPPAGALPPNEFVPPLTIEQQRDFIRNDVAQQLVAAGRPAEEAQAAGALIAARYETRAARFNGALGTAEELYKREGAQIKGAAGGAAPAATTPAPQAPAPTTAEAEAPTETVDLTPKGPRGPSARNPATFSLLEFIAARGGIRSDDPLIADLRQSFGGKNKFIPGFGQLIREPKELSTAARKSGRYAPMTLDNALEAAIEAGYIREPGEATGGVNTKNIGDLLEAIDEEARGNRRYREGHEREVKSTEQEQFEHEHKQLLDDLDAHVKEAGGAALTDAEKSRAAELYFKEGVHETSDILERLFLEADNAGIEAGGEPRDEAIPGWDIPYEHGGAEGEGAAAADERPEQPGGATGAGGGAGAGEAAGAAWKRFFDNRKERRESARIATGHNDHLTRQGAEIRAKRSQEMELGNVIDVGFVKNLLITSIENDGTINLLAKPNSAGQSQKYTVRPHEGMVKEDKVDFLEATKHLNTAAEQEDVESEYFQRKPTQRNLIAEREAEGQMGLPGTERIGQGELAQRKANEPLRPSVEQKPMDEGLFGTEKDQKELFQQPLTVPTFYSQVARTIENAKQEKASPEQWRAFLKNQPGIKGEEMQWLGLDDWLQEQAGPVTRQQIADYVRANSIEVTEAVHADREAIAPDAQAIAEHKQEWDNLVGKIREARAQEDRRDLTAADLPTGYTLDPIPPGKSSYQYRILRNGDPLTFGNSPQKLVRDVLHQQTRELEDALDELHRVSVSETVARQGVTGKPKFGQYSLPGGENYRELLLTLPPQKTTKPYPQWLEENYTGVDSDHARELYKEQLQPGANFKSSHWEEPNVLAHIRFDDRVVDGKKTLHVAEVQSDWHQAGRRKGYVTDQDEIRKRADAARIEADSMRDRLYDVLKRNDFLGFDNPGSAMGAIARDGPQHWEFETPEDAALAQLFYDARQRQFAAERQYNSGAVPDAPFKTTWPELALKRMLRYAADNGYDRLTWDTGETNAERYNLSTHLDKLKVVEWPDGKYHVEGFKDNQKIVDHWANNKEELPDLIGKGRADAALAEIEKNKNPTDKNKVPKYSAEFTGDRIDLGGEGMHGFYDDILPKVANKLVKKYGAKVEPAHLETGEDEVDVPFQILDRNGQVEQRGIFDEAHAARRAEEIGGTYEFEPGIKVGVHSIDITPELREAATTQGFPLFQAAQGKVNIREGARPIITLMKTADASTFIHETGHVFLEEMMRDAEHEQAPDNVKEDAQTVRDWLGLKGDELIQTRHHEKFARGFEQYLREGVAPSPQLAGVFAQFRDWLLRIYQSLKGLGSEITPDIRSVFDRLLAQEPQRTVIAPDLVKPPTLQDIHESDAAHTEPHEAEPAMDRVMAEAARFASELPPELTAEHGNAATRIEPAPGAAEPAAEGGAGAGEPRPLVEGGPRPAIEPAGGAGGAQHGAELPGGSDARAEGAGLPGAAGAGPEQPRPDAALSDKPLAPRPTTLLGPEQSDLVDKAGNIRLENLTDVEDVREAIRQSARENQDFIGDTQGVVTDGQVMDLANDLGMVGAEKLVAERVKGQAFNASQIIALRKLLIQSATDLSAAMKKAAKGTDEDVMAYAAAKARHQMIQGTVAQATAEAGRALRAFRNIKQEQAALGIDQILRDATGKTLYQLRNEAHLGAELSTPQQVSKFMIDAEKHTFGRMILEYWINGLISGPATHVTYSIGNQILALQKAGPETAAAAIIGQIQRALGREGATVRMGEVAAQLAAARRGYFPAAKAAAEAFRTGVTTLLPGEAEAQGALPLQPGSEFARPATLDEAANFHDAMTATFGIFQGLKDGFRAAGALQDAPAVSAQYSHLGAIPDIAVYGRNVLPVGTLARLPSRFIAAIHSFYRSVNYSMEKAAIAYRTAANEGLTGQAFDARVADIHQNPSEQVMEQSRGTATELTLMGQGGEFTKALSRLTNTPIFGLPILKFIDPFVHISSNIIEQSIIERTPVGILSPEIRADLMGKNGTIAQDTAMARMLVGTAYAVAIGGLAAEGYVSGSGPSDPRQAAIWRLAGNQAHSVRVGDIWYDVHRLGPMGMLMGISADLYDVAHQASQGDLLHAASVLQHAVTQNILDESFMRGPSDLIKAIDDPGRYGEAYIRNWLSSFVPYSVGMAQIARASDPYSRQARSVMDAIKQKIPGLSETLLPRRDIWGEPLPSYSAFLAPGVTAIYETRMSRDPVNLALLNLGIAPAYLPRKIRNVDLTEDQYDDFQRIAGRMTKMRLDAIVHSPDFAMWPNHIRHDVISEVITQSREAARGLMMAKYPQIVRDATVARLKKLKD